MPTTTSFDFGDLVLVPFPFTDQTASKKRPAAVVSSADYHRHRHDLIIVAVTSQVRPAVALGEVTIAKWQAAGLLKPSVVKPVVATVDRALVLRKFGRLHDDDRDAVRELLASSSAPDSVSSTVNAVPVGSGACEPRPLDVEHPVERAR